MTDRINLTQLRQRAETGDTHPELYDTGSIDIDITTLLALIDAAEAADDLLELYHAEKHGAPGGPCEACANSPLGHALDRFDHT